MSGSRYSKKLGGKRAGGKGEHRTGGKLRPDLVLGGEERQPARQGLESLLGRLGKKMTPLYQGPADGHRVERKGGSCITERARPPSHWSMWVLNFGRKRIP